MFMHTVNDENIAVVFNFTLFNIWVKIITKVIRLW